MFQREHKHIFIFNVIQLHIAMTQVFEILPWVKRTYSTQSISWFLTDDLATQGTRPTATMVFTMLNRIHSVPTR